MCAIAGIYNLRRIDKDIKKTEVILKHMTDCLHYRGPDGEGNIVLDDGHVFFGHRRLAVIDLSYSASQPMQTKDGRFCITYNGEIYNYREIKDELRTYGCEFSSNSDTEVVLQAYAVWGKESLNKFNGIFAFAIWDDLKKKLILVRDRYGAKPLYYCVSGEQMLFASEYKAFLEHPEFKKTLNFHTVKEYFTFQNIFTKNTMYDGVYLLSSGSYIEFDYEDDQLPEEVSYWDFVFEENTFKINREEYEAELSRLFEQAVRRQLISDVPVGTYLSGGIDSGAISAIASRHICPLKTFTCGFDLHSASGLELGFDEREKAEHMSYIYGTEHYEMVLKAGDMERCMEDLVWHVEDPRVGQSYPNYYAAKLSSHFVKVILAGTGGDEIFAGYPWRYYRAVNCNSEDEYCRNYYSYWQRILNDNEQKKIFSPIWDKMSKYSTYDDFKSILLKHNEKGMSPEKNVNRSLYLEAKTFLNGLLIVEDKLSMAFGLETRVPFLDNELVDFATKIPVSEKLGNLSKVVSIDENLPGNKMVAYYQKNNEGKSVLRRSMRKYLPPDISEGKKQGFSAPDASWFKGESIEYVRNIIDNPNSKMYTYMDYFEVKRIVDEHMNGISNRRLLIWSLLNFETWLRLFL